MYNLIFRGLGIKINLPDVEPTAYAQEPAELPVDHPCSSCSAIDLRSGVPYCFLPKCDKDVFHLKCKSGEPFIQNLVAGGLE